MNILPTFDPIATTTKYNFVHVANRPMYDIYGYDSVFLSVVKVLAVPREDSSRRTRKYFMKGQPQLIRLGVKAQI